MLVEHLIDHSTSAPAPLYAPCMRNSITALSLSLSLILACGEDDAPTRPEDGTVKVWEACAWDGQVVPELCEPELVCTYHGVCAPTCETVDDCPTFEGFEVRCARQADKDICKPMCDDLEKCPKTGGVELHCLDFHCIGDP